MTQEQAYDKLSEYIDGGLTPDERRELEFYASTDSDFADAIILCRTMNCALEDLDELTPRLDFTVRVLHKAGIIDQLPVEVPKRWSETAERWAPVVAVLGAVSIGASALWDTLYEFARKLGGVVTDLTGVTVFASSPTLVMSLCIPVIAAVVVGMSLSGRWNMLRQ